MRLRILAALLIGGVAFWLGRQSLPELRDRIDPPTPRERYERRLEQAGLMELALGRLWRKAGERALREAPVVDAPFRELGYLDPSRPQAVAYRLHARAGVRLRFQLELNPATNALIFMDVFRAPADSLGAPSRVASAEPNERTLVVEPARDGDYIVRVQPELLRGGGYTLTAVAEPTLAFPVAGAGPANVRSVFGDPRDGGSRDHHGIDIFAPRGTPVVAAVEGRISSVRTTEIGGRVVWLRDERRGQSIYYAHLDEQRVEPGARVAVGDTLGSVGNSGNARSTPPHLHFGVYRRGRGPLDPMPFVEPRPTRPADPALPRPTDGSVRRVAASGTRLRSGPGEDAPVLSAVDGGAPVWVEAVAGEWLRVRGPNGASGYVAARLTRPASPLDTVRLGEPTPLLAGAVEGAAALATLQAGDEAEVLGRLPGRLYVRVGGREGWLVAGTDLPPRLDRRGRNAGQ